MLELNLSFTPGLYKAQAEAVGTMCNRAARVGRLRLMLAAQTGCGKTAMAIAAAEQLGCHRILVVCPAIVRWHWATEFAKWASRVCVGVIEMGPTRKATKGQTLARNWAYAQPVQIVSYDLLPHVQPHGWDMIIIDEAHNVGYPASKQSRMVRNLVKQGSPDAHVLCLSATLMPRSPLQVWHLLHLLGVESVGGLGKANSIPWPFIYTYFEVIKNEYGEAPGPLKEDKAEALCSLVSKHAVMVRREDIAPSLPPLRVAPLHVAKLDRQLYIDWLRSMPQDVTHVVILPYHREEAMQVTGAVCQMKGVTPFHIDGSMDATERVLRMHQASLAREGLTVLIATQESVAEGIRFMWAQKALITEPQTVPGKLTQLFGRFQSVGSTARPLVEVVIEAARTFVCDIVMERAAEINAVQNHSIAQGVISTFVAQEITPERAASAFDSMTYCATDNSWESDEW